MATLLTAVTSELAPRRKVQLFQFALLRAGRIAFTAGNITAAQYASILAIYQRPWRRSLASIDLQVWSKVRGSGYIVGDVLTLVQTGGTNGSVIVGVVNQTGGVTGVLPLHQGTGYTPGVATVSGGSGTGAQIGLMPSAGATIDVLDQVRVDVQNSMSGQSWYAAITTAPNNRGTTIRDWGNPKTTLGCLQSVITNGIIFNGTLNNAEGASVGAYGSGSFEVGNLATNSGNTYYCSQANTGNAQAPSGTSTNTAYWIYLPAGGTNNSGQLLCPLGVALAAITGRLAAIAGGLV